MKKSLIATVLGIVCLINTAQYIPVEAAESNQMRNECHCHGAKEISDRMITVKYEDLDKVIKDNKGTPLLQVEGNTPTIIINSNKKASSKINSFYKTKLKDFEQDIRDYTQMAKKDYSRRNEELKKSWHAYSLGTKYTTSRVDNCLISFIQNDYEYTGGAHPNATRFAQTFSTVTGKRLTLEDIATNVEEATQSINDYILQETKKKEDKGYFFEDYEKHIKDILTEDTWYFSDEGLVVISNEYIISPHSTGILEFTIPYNELSFIKPEYLTPINKCVEDVEDYIEAE